MGQAAALVEFRRYGPGGTAAPGGKSTHLAALMGDEGEVLAVERNPARAAALQETARRLRAARFFVEGISLKFALSVLMAFICRWRQIRRIQRLLAFSRWEFGRG